MRLEEWSALRQSTKIDSNTRQIERIIGGLQLLTALTVNDNNVITVEYAIIVHGPSPENRLWTNDNLRRLATYGWFWSFTNNNWFIVTNG